jgi:hypothetical protein
MKLPLRKKQLHRHPYKTAVTEKTVTVTLQSLLLSCMQFTVPSHTQTAASAVSVASVTTVTVSSSILTALELLQLTYIFA